MEVLLKADHISFAYGDKQILEDITLPIEQGAFITLLGPNGSGKTTLLKNLAAFLTPQKGCVFLNGTELSKIKSQDLAKKMAVVPQNSQISFPFTAFDTVLLGRMPHQRRFQADSPKDLAVAEWAMKLTNTWHLRDRLVTELSGGEKQRVIVAQALAKEPQILLLDEPTAHLDLEHQLDLLDLLAKLNKTSGLTVVAVLHDLNLAAKFSSYTVLLNQGKIFAAGTPAEVLTSQNIAAVYNIEVRLVPTLNGGFHLIPLGKFKPRPVKRKDLHVHLICGGGRGSAIMEELVEEGYRVSCGVLNIGDSDWHTAKALGLEMVEEAPFTPIRAETYEKNLALLEQADLVIVLPIPFGPGNLGNLLQAQQIGLKGKKVILVEPATIEDRDFTAGEAVRIYREMMEKHATVDSPSQIMTYLTQEEDLLCKRKEEKA